MDKQFVWWGGLFSEMRGEVFGHLDAYSGQALAMTCKLHWATYGKTNERPYKFFDLVTRAHPHYLHRRWTREKKRKRPAVPLNGIFREWFAGLAHRNDFDLFKDYVLDAMDWFQDLNDNAAIPSVAVRLFQTEIYKGVFQGNNPCLEFIDFATEVLHQRLLTGVVMDASSIVCSPFVSEPSLVLLQHCCRHASLDERVHVFSDVNHHCWRHEKPLFFIQCAKEWPLFQDYISLQGKNQILCWIENIWELSVTIVSEHSKALLKRLTYLTAIKQVLAFSPAELREVMFPSIVAKILSEADEPTDRALRQVLYDMDQLPSA
jgi:hypothetical protein